jgi:hypothetical protein
MKAFQALSLDDVCGTWQVVRTEIPEPYNPAHEFFQFFPDGSLVWEYPFIEQPNKTVSFRYELTDTGAKLTTVKGDYYSDLGLRVEDGFLIMTARHGYSSWLQRIAFHDRPPFLSLYCDPPKPQSKPNKTDADKLRSLEVK